jgi:hypothetical protein
MPRRWLSRLRSDHFAENVPPGIKKADHDAGLQSSLQNLKRYLALRRSSASH